MASLNGFAEIVLVRHGETSWNASKIIQGHLNSELNEIGRQQATAVNFDPALRERHLGELQGLALRDAAKLKTEAYQYFLSKSRDQEIPGGGESLNQLHDRCTSCVEGIAKKHQGERVIVVTHGGVLRELYKHAAPNSKFPNGTVLNTSVHVIRISENGKWSIKTWGDISHLQEIEVIKSTIAEEKNFWAV